MTNPTEPNRMRELGRAGGKASGEARRRRKSRGFLDVLRGEVERDPERLVESLLSSAPGSVVAARVLEKAGGLGGEEQAPAQPELEAHGPAAGFHDLIALAVETGQEVALLGFALTDSQRELVRARASSSAWGGSAGARGGRGGRGGGGRGGRDSMGVTFQESPLAIA